MYKNLGLLQNQSFGLCSKCKSNNQCSFTDERGAIYCGTCGLDIMGLPHDTKMNIDSINRAVAIRDSNTEPEEVFVEPQTEDKPTPQTTRGATVFHLKELDTGYLLRYSNQEHYLTSKTAVIKHLKEKVL